MHKWLPNFVAKFWLPNLVLYRTVYMQPQDFQSAMCRSCVWYTSCMWKAHWKTSNELCGTVCTITLSAAVEKACKAFSLRNSFAGSVGIRTSRLIISSFIKINYRVPGITRRPMCHHLQTAMQRHSIRMNCSAPILFYLWPLLLTLFNFNPSMEK